MFQGLQSLIPKKNNQSNKNKDQENSLDLNLSKKSNLNQKLSPLIQPTHQYIFNIEIEKIKSNPYQPRTSNDQQSINELAQSINEHGILQPIIVTKITQTTSSGGEIDKYELISGHRRLTAAKIAGLNLIPAIIQKDNISNQEKLELALIENIQRKNLNPIEKAKAFSRLRTEFGLTLDEIGQRVGKNRKTISQIINLLRLNPEIQQAVADGQITEGQVRSLITLNQATQKKLFIQIIKEKLNSRESENLVRETKKVLVKSYRRNPRKQEFEQATQQISKYLDIPIKIQSARSSDGGKIIIQFEDLEELSQLVQKITSSTLI